MSGMFYLLDETEGVNTRVPLLRNGSEIGGGAVIRPLSWFVLALMFFFVVGDMFTGILVDADADADADAR